MSVENMNRDELIEAIVDWQIHTFMSGQDQAELRNILLYGHGYRTTGPNGRSNWDVDELRNYAKDLGV